MGLDAPSSGGVDINGRPFRQLPWPLREVGALLEAKAIHPGRSAYNHLRALAESNAIPLSRVDEVLGVVGLEKVAKKRAGKFSLGMGQRLGIAAALLVTPMSCSSTSRSTASTPRASAGSAPFCAHWPARVAPCSSPATS